MDTSKSKITVEDAMTMSLEEYIQVSGIKVEEKYQKPNYYRPFENVEVNNVKHQTDENMDLTEKFDDLNLSSSTTNCFFKQPKKSCLQNRLNPSFSASSQNNRVRLDTTKNNWNKGFEIINGRVQKRNQQQRNGFTTRHNYTLFKNCTTVECTIPQNNSQNKSKNTNMNNMANQISNTSCETILKNELLPMIAGNLLNLVLHGKNEEEKPKYDLTIQKEIHSIQGKQMTYKCPGGAVISSDGNGIDCDWQPKTTGLSLNQRFA